MNPGKLDKRIIIQKLTHGTNENGFPADSWDEFKPVWASKNNLYGREFFAAAAVNAEQTAKFVMRYLKELDQNINDEGTNTTKTFRIKYGNLFYGITFIDDIKSEHKFMEIKTISEVS
jgi:SPP1 family predicted phage head-tail adaptor